MKTTYDNSQKKIRLLLNITRLFIVLTCFWILNWWKVYNQIFFFVIRSKYSSRVINRIILNNKIKFKVESFQISKKTKEKTCKANPLSQTIQNVRKKQNIVPHEKLKTQYKTTEMQRGNLVFVFKLFKVYHAFIHYLYTILLALLTSFVCYFTKW